jgi:hypothetical protein
MGGTAAEYVAQLQVMHQAVKDADPDAVVVLGGAPYALPAAAPDSSERAFFDTLLRDGRDFFDLFDLHLYGDASRILADIETTRGMMRAFGYEKPLVVGEYNAPWPNLYPEATAAMEKAMAAVFAAGAAVARRPSPGPRSSWWRACPLRWARPCGSAPDRTRSSAGSFPTTGPGCCCSTATAR